MNWHRLTAWERRRLARLEHIAEGMTDISWTSARARKVTKQASKAAYAALHAVVEAEYRKIESRRRS